MPEKRRQFPDGTEVIDYKEEEVKDPVCKAIIRQAYRMFRVRYERNIDCFIDNVLNNCLYLFLSYSWVQSQKLLIITAYKV